MADWVHKLKVKDLIAKRDEETISIVQLGEGFAERIRALKLNKNVVNDHTDQEFELMDIAEQFEGIVKNEEDEADFDTIMEQLYDWADQLIYTPKHLMQRKMCWIETF